MNELQIFQNPEATEHTPIEVLLKVGGDGKVSSRDVYEFLQMHPRHYARWCKSNIEDNQFAEQGADYEGAPLMVNGNQTIDYRLSARFAKKLCQLSKTPRGEQARDYFIKVEDKLKEVARMGGYMVPRTLPEALRLAADYAEKNQQLTAQIEEQRPKVQLAEAVTASENSISVNELAKILKQNGVDIGRNRLLAWFRNNEYLCKSKGDEYNLPTQRSADMELFEVEEYTFVQSGIVYTKFTPKVTRKGQAYFIEKFCSKAVAE